MENSADPDEMLHYAAFHLCLHCLSNYSFMSFQKTFFLYIYIFFFALQIFIPDISVSRLNKYINETQINCLTWLSNLLMIPNVGLQILENMEPCLNYG